MPLFFSLNATAQTISPGTAGQTIQQTPQQDASARQQDSIAIQQQSIIRQRASVRRQWNALQSSGSADPANLEGFFELPSVASASALDSASFAPDCETVPLMALQNVVQNAATAYNVAPDLINAVIHQESAGYPCAKSDKGAMGLMQLMPATAAQMGASDPYDITQNVEAGTRLLAELLQRYKGDLNRVLGAYNAGPVAVDNAGGIPPFPETLNYVRSVLDQVKPIFDPKLSVPSIR